jgi:hypothetical protein
VSGFSTSLRAKRSNPILLLYCLMDCFACARIDGIGCLTKFIRVIPGCALLAQARNPYSLPWLWIPGSRSARPGMTVLVPVGFSKNRNKSVHQYPTAPSCVLGLLSLKHPDLNQIRH